MQRLKRGSDRCALVAEEEGWPCGCLQTCPEGTGYIPGDVMVSDLHVMFLIHPQP